MWAFTSNTTTLFQFVLQFVLEKFHFTHNILCLTLHNAAPTSIVEEQHQCSSSFCHFHGRFGMLRPPCIRQTIVPLLHSETQQMPWVNTNLCQLYSWYKTVLTHETWSGPGMSLRYGSHRCCQTVPFPELIHPLRTPSLPHSVHPALFLVLPYLLQHSSFMLTWPLIAWCGGLAAHTHAVTFATVVKLFMPVDCALWWHKRLAGLGH